MASNQSEMLLELSTIDKSIVSKEREIKILKDTLDSSEANYASKSAVLEKIEAEFKKAQANHQVEERKLKEEEVKIVERRKQLTSLGGAKSAKLVERELDIAKRIMESLELNALNAIQLMDDLSKKRNTLNEEVEALKTTFDSNLIKFNEVTESGNKEIETLKKQRKDILVTLDARLQTLYKRVESRYRGDAVAIAENGSCRSCFRALPAQTFNQVIAGYNLIQCPGCSRILIHVASDDRSIEKSANA